MPFSMSVVAGLDRCVTPGPGPRVPQRILLRFSRSSKATPGQETFELKSVLPLEGRPGQPPATESPLRACLSSLVGQTLLIPAGAAPQESSFEEIITIPIPASVAWASPQPPQFPR